jgi:hypothetical protein
VPLSLLFSSSFFQLNLSSIIRAFAPIKEAIGAQRHVRGTEQREQRFLMRNRNVIMTEEFERGFQFNGPATSFCDVEATVLHKLNGGDIDVSCALLALNLQAENCLWHGSRDSPEWQGFRKVLSLQNDPQKTAQASVPNTRKRYVDHNDDGDGIECDDKQDHAIKGAVENELQKVKICVEEDFSNRCDLTKTITQEKEACLATQPPKCLGGRNLKSPPHTFFNISRRIRNLYARASECP